MTFAHNVKSELCTVENEKKCCKKAELYGCLIFARTFLRSEITVQTEHPEAAQRIAANLESLFGIEPGQKVIRRRDGRIIDCLSIEDKTEINRIFNEFGYERENVSLRINRANIENECCVRAFIRGAFLSCGSIVDPGKDYHLEFVSPHIRLGRDFADFLDELSFVPKTIVRKGNFVVYFKDSEQIEDILTAMGAAKHSLELMNVKIYKDLRNKVNRVTNCDTANIGKTVNAATRQIEAINRLIKTKGYEFLPDELQKIARIRLENPDSSLRELAEIAGISRSGVNHRLNRIMNIVEKM